MKEVERMRAEGLLPTGIISTLAGLRLLALFSRESSSSSYVQQ